MNRLAMATDALNTHLQIASFKMSSSVNQPDCRAAALSQTQAPPNFSR